MQIRILASAKADLSCGARFYESLGPGLGLHFLDCLEEDINGLLIYAGVHVKVAGFHRLLSGHFPFAVYYSLEREHVDIYAVLDCRADPEAAALYLTELSQRR